LEEQEGCKVVQKDPTGRVICHLCNLACRYLSDNRRHLRLAHQVPVDWLAPDQRRRAPSSQVAAPSSPPPEAPFSPGASEAPAASETSEAPSSASATDSTRGADSETEADENQDYVRVRVIGRQRSILELTNVTLIDNIFALIIVMSNEAVPSPKSTSKKVLQKWFNLAYEFVDPSSESSRKLMNQANKLKGQLKRRGQGSQAHLSMHHSLIHIAPVSFRNQLLQ
jgi:hypothetical protein